MSLIGTWVADATDSRSMDEWGNVVLEFKEDGWLIYTVRNDAKNQIINLRYRVEGAAIVTDQPTAPREERTVFSLSEDGALTLGFGGVPYRFQRLSCKRGGREKGGIRL